MYTGNNMKDNISFYCLGAAHNDIKARALTRPLMGDSVPVEISHCLGGVACNIAVNLAYCGARVALLSCVGKDSAGHNLIKSLELNNIDTRDILLSPFSPTAKYYAFLTPEGELFVAGADMKIYEEISIELVSPLISQRSHMSDWIIDANISGPTIKLVAQNIKSHQRLWGIGVSTHKTAALAQGFPHYYGLILNQDELLALTKIPDAQQALRVLRAQGCSYIIVTAGALGVFYCDEENIGFRECCAREIIDATGAGDAFSAGVIYSLAAGENLEQALEKGFSLAALALNSPNSCLI